jgi:hypothetical protein
MTEVAPSVLRRLRYTRLRDLLRGRFNAGLDWRLVVADAELPAEISMLIEQIVGRTRLWRGEKVDVVTELIAHFQDGLDAGNTPVELMRAFGEPRQTARLIRRAKKRGRSIAWHLWRCACWAVGAMVVAYAAAVLWMLKDRPTITTDFLVILNERALSVPESEKAWPLYREALLSMHAARREVEPDNPFITASESTPSDASWSATQTFLAEHAQAIAQLRAAAAKNELGFVTSTRQAAFSGEDRKLFGISVTPAEIEASQHQTVQDHWIIGALLPHLDFLRSSSSLLANDSRRAAADGDGATAAEDIAAIYNISRHCQEMPLLVAMIAAEAAQQQARIAIQDVLREHPRLWTHDQLRNLAHLTAATEIDWRRGFIGERAAFLDSMQRIYTDDGDGDGRIAFRVAGEGNFTTLQVLSRISGVHDDSWLYDTRVTMAAMPALNTFVASRKDMTNMYDRYLHRSMVEAATPLWEVEDLPPLDEEFPFALSGSLESVRYLFVRLMVPPYGAVRSRIAQYQGMREGVMAGLALELHHREHGQWPASLNELAPRWLPAIPVDRITGETLHYRIVDDRPIVYSAGVDRDDDGGQAPRYYAQRALPYVVGLAYEAFPKQAPEFKDRYEGDWLLWSTVARIPASNKVTAGE